MKFMWKITSPVIVIIILSLVQFTMSDEKTTLTSSITSTSENEASKNNDNSKIETSQTIETISTTENGENKQTSTDKQPITASNKSDCILLRPVKWFVNTRTLKDSFVKTKNALATLYELPSTKTNEIINN